MFSAHTTFNTSLNQQFPNYKESLFSCNIVREIEGKGFLPLVFPNIYHPFL
jgi:hypothetical protein